MKNIIGSHWPSKKNVWKDLRKTLSELEQEHSRLKQQKFFLQQDLEERTDSLSSLREAHIKKVLELQVSIADKETAINLERNLKDTLVDRNETLKKAENLKIH